MKKTILTIFLLLSITVFSQQQTATYSVSPSTFEETTSITITINGSSINESTWGVIDNKLYLWAWAFDTNDTTQKGTPDNGAWDNSSDASVFTMPEQIRIQKLLHQQAIIIQPILEK